MKQILSAFLIGALLVTGFLLLDDQIAKNSLNELQRVSIDMDKDSHYVTPSGVSYRVKTNRYGENCMPETNKNCKGISFSIGVYDPNNTNRAPLIHGGSAFSHKYEDLSSLNTEGLWTYPSGTIFATQMIDGELYVSFTTYEEYRDAKAESWTKFQTLFLVIAVAALATISTDIRKGKAGE